jgi:hypothetical protein
MAEAGRRELPQPAYQWLADLTEKVEAEKRAENRGFLPEEESFAEALQRLTAQAREMDWKIRKLQRQREVETGRYQQCRLRLRAVRLMRSTWRKPGAARRKWRIRNTGLRRWKRKPGGDSVPTMLPPWRC